MKQSEMEGGLALYLLSDLKLEILVIQFKDFGTHLGTRVEGIPIREKIIHAIQQQEMVIFDLEGVEMVTNSFADECFAKLTLTLSLSTIKTFTHFRNVNDFNRAVIANAFRTRLKRSTLTMS